MHLRPFALACPRSPIRFVVLLTAVFGLARTPLGAQLAPDSAQLWWQDSPGLSIPIQEDSYFGGGLAAGDFDGDGFDDLAFGLPEYDHEETDTGLVLVTYGEWSGIATVGEQIWTQLDISILDDAEENDRFGAALAAGDFDADGYDDLVIGVPGETIGAETSAGAIQILYGSASGLSTVDQFIYQGAGGGGFLGTAEASDRYGSTLAVGRLNDDAYDDLVVGVPYETVSDQVGAGAVHVYFGSAGGITATGDRILYLGGELPRTPGEGENLGWSLAIGDFDPESAVDELAIGAPGTTVNELLDAGAVWIVANLGGTLEADTLHLDVLGMPDAAQFGDQFGCALAAGQFSPDAGDELAITACRKPVDSQDDAGKVYAHAFGRHTSVAIAQSAFPDEAPEPDDFFGSSLAAADIDADGVDELMIGVPFEDLASAVDAGVVHTFDGIAGFGAGKSVGTTLVQVGDPSEAGDRFGLVLAPGRISGHSGSDLAVAAPYESDDAIEWTGAVNLFFSDALFVDGFEDGDLLGWSAVAGGI